ncbi:response regulator [Pseudorhodobacter sp.]|uniref:response regulator n=1 Tax=Pseudorhodobacter sp. TaxID=1934400 RepID=UPI0039E6FAF7
MKKNARPSGDPLSEELALLGHDIRSAISDILAGLALIDDSRLDLSDRQQLDRTKATTETLAGYLEDGMATLLAQAPREVQPVRTNLSRFLGDLSRRWSYSADRKTNAVIITSSGLPDVVLCNRNALNRILSNLISNAITHSDGQPVSLTVSHPAPDKLHFIIADKGPGFPENIADRPGHGSAGNSALPAWEGHEGQGHGLGLNIAQTLAQRMGAVLRLHNQAGGGAVAELLLPISIAADLPVPPADTSCLMGKTVLIADDSAPQLLLLKHYLAECGARVTALRDGAAAEAALIVGQFDLALIDLEMPGRSGLEICAALRNHPAKTDKPTSIVILTAHQLPSIHQKALAAGANRVLVKPFTSASALAAALCGDLPPAAEPRPALDATAFMRLLDIAGPDMAAELLARYQEDLTSVQARLVAGLAANDWKNLSAASHVLIALAGTAGMGDLEQACREFNLAANDADSVSMAKHRDAMLNGLADLLSFVKRTALERQDLS